jgi:hypothetical protein
MGAMPEEVAGIIELLGNAISHRIGDREYHVGRCHGTDTVVVFSRWGKVAASAIPVFRRFEDDGHCREGKESATPSPVMLGLNTPAREMRVVIS